MSGLELAEPGIEFLFALPDREVRGSGLDDLGAYLAGRPVAGRKHVILRSCADGDLEMVYGILTEGDGKGIGSFVSVGLVSPAGRLALPVVLPHGVRDVPAAGGAVVSTTAAATTTASTSVLRSRRPPFPLITSCRPPRPPC